MYEKWEEYTKNVNQLSEMEIYFKIDNMLGDFDISKGYLDYLKKTNKSELNKMVKIESVNTDLNEIIRYLNFTIMATKKFGVSDLIQQKENKLIQFSEKFKMWLGFWRKWEESLDSDVATKLRQNTMDKEEIKKYVPSGSWKDIIKS